MRRSLWWLVPLLLIAATAALWWRSDPPESLASSYASEQSPSGAAAEPAAGLVTPAPTAIAQTPAPVVAAETKPLFVGGFEASLRADAEDKLVMDTETLQALEMLTGMSVREREQRLQRLGEQLPPVAASQALDLLRRVTDYRTAAQQILPPGSPPTTAAEARSMLEAVHRLRIDYLGEEAARIFFAQEEARARRVIESLDAAANTTRTAEEQARYDARLLSMAFSMFILPRKVPRAIGQQDEN
jgi:hypothetical protein